MTETRSCDVLVIGAGAGGMVSALRAHDLGLDALLIEKADRYGGTSAVSGGGIWIPNNPAIAATDSREQALEYLSVSTKGKVPAAKLAAYVDAAPRLVEQLTDWGVGYFSVPGYADYMPWLPGALQSGGRTMMPLPFDARALGDELFHQREPHPTHKVLGRMQIDLAEMAPLIRRMGAWWWTAAKLFLRYWSDLPFRFRSGRDRRLTTGNALVGGLRRAMMERNVPLLRDTRLLNFIEEEGRIVGARVSNRGNEYDIRAAKGVIVATGGVREEPDAARPAPAARHADRLQPDSWPEQHWRRTDCRRSGGRRQRVPGAGVVGTVYACPRPRLQQCRHARRPVHGTRLSSLPVRQPQRQALRQRSDLL